MSETLEAYERWHSELSVDIESDAPWHRLVKAHLDPSRDLANREVLEIGCGRGGFACWLASHEQMPRKVTAADFSPRAIQMAKQAALELKLANITFMVQDIQSIDVPDASFETVISCETVEHVPSPRRAIFELARVLKPGGRLIVTTPNYMSTRGLYRAYLLARGRRYSEMDQPINNWMLLPVLTSWVRQAGLVVKEVDAIGHYLPFPGRPPIVVPLLDNGRPLTKWFGLHSMVVAQKPNTL